MENLNEQLDRQTLLTENALRRYFDNNQAPGFSNYLFNNIVNRINIERKSAALKKLKLRLTAAAGVLTGALIVFATALETVLKAFAQSPALHFMSLLFTDFGSVISNWQDFAFSVSEALPLGTVLFLLTALLASAVLGEYVAFQWGGLKKSLIK